MALVPDNVAIFAGTASVASASFALTATTGATLLVYTQGNTSTSISSIAANGNALTLLGAVNFGTSTRQELWGLTAAPSGVLSISANVVGGGARNFAMAGLTFVGQRTSATPFGAVVSATVAAAASANISISSNVNNIAIVAWGQSASAIAINVNGTNQYVRANVTASTLERLVVTTGRPHNAAFSASASGTSVAWGILGINLIASAVAAEADLTNVFSAGAVGGWFDPGHPSFFRNTGVELTSYGNVFDTWVDRSGNGCEVSQSNASLQGLATLSGTFASANMVSGGYDSNTGGGASVAFYFVAAVNSSTYYGTYFADSTASTAGILVQHNGDNAQDVMVTVGNGTGTRAAISTSSGNAPFTAFGQHVIAAFWDGTTLGISVDLNATATTALAAMTAGTSVFHLGTKDTAQTDPVLAAWYYCVYLKDSCPTAAQRSAILTLAISKLAPQGAIWAYRGMMLGVGR